MNFNHLTVGDHNAAQAGIIASNKTHIGTLDLWQSAGLNIIAPPEGGYKDKPNNTPSQSGTKNDKNESAKNDKQESSQNNSNTQVINPPNSTQKTEIQPTQVIDGPFAGGKDTVVNINRINTKADGTIKVGGHKASLTTNAAHLHIGKGGINLSNQASGRSLLVENLTGNITVDGPLRVNNQVGGYALAGSNANFEFKAGTDTKNGTATFNNDISLGRFVNLKVDAHTANFKGIDTGNGGFNTLDFSGVTNKVNINKLITASTNVAVKNFNINELIVKTNGVSVGEYTHFSEDIGYGNVSAGTNSISNVNLIEQFKERLALYNNNNRMDICVVRNTDDIKACGAAIGNQSMVNNPDNYKYLIGKAWKNIGISKTANGSKISVHYLGNSTPTENSGNTTNLPTNTTSNARSANNALAQNAPFAQPSATPNLVAINQHDFGTIESVFELANRSKDIDTLYANSGAQGRNLLQTLLIDSHDAGYARKMIDATSANEITKQLNTATTTLNNIASLEHKTSGLQTLSLSNAMILNSRLVNLSRRHTNNIDSFAKRLQALKGQRFASLESAAEVLYQFAPKYEKPTNVWANAIGGTSLNSGGNASLYGTSAGVDAYLNGQVEAIVGGFGSYGYSSFSNQANSLNSGANNTNFGVYSRIFANQHEFDFEAQGALGSDQSSLNFKSALLQDLNQSYHYLAYSAATRASYGYDFAFFKNALVLKPSVGVSYNHLGSTNFKSNSANKVALSNGSSSQHLFNASANVEARYYYGDTSYFYMNAGVLQEFANFGSSNAVSLNTFKVNAAHNPLNTHARVMMGGELKLAKEVFLNLGFVYLHNLISNIGHFASNLGMRYSF